MKILITGHRGLLGSACVRHFAPKHEVITSGDVDLRNTSAAFAMLRDKGIDAVIHCAAKVGGVESNKNLPVEFLSDNVLIQHNVINGAGYAGIQHLVFVGTSCMFPNDAVQPVREESLMTGKLNDSVEAYAIAKIAGWRLCKAWTEQYGKHFITVAPCNIYGPNDNYGPNAHVIPALIRKVHKASIGTGKLQVWGDGSAVREFIHVDDVARGMAVALAKWKSPEVLNIGSGQAVTIRELVSQILANFSVEMDVEWQLDKPVGVPRKTFDVSKLKSLGWEPKMTLEKGLKQTINDFFDGNGRFLS